MERLSILPKVTEIICEEEEFESSGSEVKASACNAGDLGSIPGSGRSPGEGNGNPLQYSCLENPEEPGAWATVHEVEKSRMQLSDFTFTFFQIQSSLVGNSSGWDSALLLQGARV